MKEIPPHRERRAAARFDPETKTRMGQQLRVMYGEVMNQGVPDCHHDLLRRLDARTKTAREG
jgi:Anti-sigma factor NepR